MNPTLSGIVALGLWSIFTVLFIYVKPLPSFQLLAMVFLLGYMAFTALQLRRGEDLASYWRQPLKYYAFWMGGAGLYTIMIYIALKKAPIFEANILNYLWPIFLVIFSACIRREALPAYRIAGMITGFAGAALMFMPERSGYAFGNFGWGHILAVASAMLWALYSSLTHKFPYPAGFQAPVFLVFALICAALHFAWEETVMPTALQGAVLVMMGITRVSYMLWDTGMKRGNVVLLASLSYFLPFVSSVLLIAFGERPGHPLIGASAGLIIAGCLLVNAPKIKQLLERKAA